MDSPGANLGVAVLQRVASFMRRLSARDLEDLVSGRADLALVRREKTKHAPARLADPDVGALVGHLQSLGSRSEGMAVLESAVPNRAGLLQIVSAMDLPIVKSDTVAQLRERIVEAAIGYRLRSEAIRGSDDRSP